MNLENLQLAYAIGIIISSVVLIYAYLQTRGEWKK